MTIQVTSTVSWVQESFHMKNHSSLDEVSEGNSIYSGLSYPILASSRYFTANGDLENKLFEVSSAKYKNVQ